MALCKETILAFMDEGLGVDTAGIDEHTTLFSSGIVDSAAMVALIEFIEGEGRVTFEPDDLSLEHLDSIDRMLRFVAIRREE